MGVFAKSFHSKSWEKAVLAHKLFVEGPECNPGLKAVADADLASHPGNPENANKAESNGKSGNSAGAATGKADRPSKAQREKALLDDLVAKKITAEEYAAALKLIQQPAGEMLVEIRDGKLCIEIEMQEPAPSASGKTLVVASSKGNVTTNCMVNGKAVVIGVNAYVKP